VVAVVVVVTMIGEVVDVVDIKVVVVAEDILVVVDMDKEKVAAEVMVETETTVIEKKEHIQSADLQSSTVTENLVYFICDRTSNLSLLTTPLCVPAQLSIVIIVS